MKGGFHIPRAGFRRIVTCARAMMRDAGAGPVVALNTLCSAVIPYVTALGCDYHYRGGTDGNATR